VRRDPRRGAVLLLHGAGGGGWEWNVWTRVLAAHGLDPRAPDLRPVAAGLEATQLYDYVEQARIELAAMPRPRAIIGASLGGLLALAVADAADALVLVNPLPPSPWHALLPAAVPSPRRVAWRARASLAGTRAALPEAGPGDALHAFRHWRDESGAVLDAARAGVAVVLPTCPLLVIASSADEDVPIAASERLAQACGAAFWRIEGASHVGPLCGREAAAIAMRVVTWLNVKDS
jgi:pimeloyl-ACP methyl ester carboxylesterase